MIRVRVHPRASRARSSWNECVLDMWVTAPPVEGAANRAVVAAVARRFKVAESKVRIRSGGRSRVKLVEVQAESSLEDKSGN